MLDLSPHVVAAVLVVFSVLYIIVIILLAYMAHKKHPPAKAPRWIERYVHHNKLVAVRSDLKGQHRDHCLCYGCDKFKPVNGKSACPIAQATFDNCVKFNTVTPVWECPEFIGK